MQQCTLPHAGKNEEVDKVHAAENQQDGTDLGAQGFEHSLRVNWIFTGLECQDDIAKIDEVKADNQEMIDGIGQGLVAMACVNEEDPPVFMECSCDPDGKRDGDNDI